MLCIAVHQQTPLTITNLTSVINVLTGTVLYVITHCVGQRNNSSEQLGKASFFIYTLEAEGRKETWQRGILSILLRSDLKDDTCH